MGKRTLEELKLEFKNRFNDVIKTKKSIENFYDNLKVLKEKKLLESELNKKEKEIISFLSNFKTNNPEDYEKLFNENESLISCISINGSIYSLSIDENNELSLNKVNTL